MGLRPTNADEDTTGLHRGINNLPDVFNRAVSVRNPENVSCKVNSSLMLLMLFPCCYCNRASVSARAGNFVAHPCNRSPTSS